jgi:hypothetical protein
VQLTDSALTALNLTAASMVFGSSVDHLRILRKIDDASALPSRARQFGAAAGCPPGG